MDQTSADKLYAPVTFKESYEVVEMVSRIERAFPGKSKAQVFRHIFRVGLQKVNVEVIQLEAGK